ncbi:MAG TPA: cytochrome c oxidase subunit I [Rhodothermales bacterium]|nr:cytochrome c oxidase subunit I [Rhodothermales bacterium]
MANPSQSVAAAQAREVQAHQHANVNYLNVDKSIKSWIYTLDHKRIGVMYGVTLAVTFLIGGILAMLVRTELLTPGPTIFFSPDGGLSAETYNRVFSMHGIIMVFLFLVPSVPAFLGNIILPMQLGAKDVAFPKINLASYYIFLLGGVFTVVALIVGKVDTGWTFYTPYSTSAAASNGVLFMTLAIFIAGFSSIFTGLNFIVTIHKMRAPGLTWNRLPLFVWSMYAVSLVQVLATPVLGVTVMLLFFERLLHIGIFDPALGGDPILFQHFFWFYSHPAVYIMILPAFGIISELVATFSRQRIFGYRAVALSSVAIALLGFMVWGHHMFVSGQSVLSSVSFSLITYLIGIPSGIKVFNWIATMYKGSVWLQTPMLYAIMFLFLFTIGGLTGVMVAVLAVDVHLTDTYYVVGHFHYVMVGGQVIAIFGGLHYWWPKITGKLYKESVGKIAAAIIFVGFNFTFFPQLVMGAHGMPRRYADYLPEYQMWHDISTIGAYVLAIGFFLAAGNLLASLFRGMQSPANPWGAATLEWTHSTSPALPHNFLRTPIVTRGPYDFHLAHDIFEEGDGAGDGTAEAVAADKGTGPDSPPPPGNVGQPIGKPPARPEK